MDNSIKEVFAIAAAVKSEDDFLELTAALMAYYAKQGYDSGHIFDVPMLKAATDKRLEALAVVKEPKPSSSKKG